MPAYATQAAFEAYVEGWTTDNAAALARLLERASHDLDHVLGARPILETGAFAGFKVDPGTLLAWEAEALSRATCAQAEWRFTVGESGMRGEIAQAPVRRIKGPDYEKEYATSVAAPKAPARYGPKVAAELEPISHLRRLTGRAIA